jgi:hypothetical protein
LFAKGFSSTWSASETNPRRQPALVCHSHISIV